MNPDINTAELAAAVLARTWPGSRDPAWRDRAVDEAVLLIELCRWLEGCHRHSPPPPTALADLFADLARRRAPLAAVRGWVETVIAQAHRELGNSTWCSHTVLAALERAYPLLTPGGAGAATASPTAGGPCACARAPGRAAR